MWGSRMTEPEQGWRESVDGVVSDFDEVTQHLRHRQQQALRVAWSVVGACAAAMAALIVLNLPARIPGASPLRIPAQALLDPVTGLPDAPPAAEPSDHPAAPGPTVPAAAQPGSGGDAPPGATTVPTHPAPITVASTTTAPVEVAPAPPGAPAPAGLVDGLVKGVLHLLG